MLESVILLLQKTSIYEDKSAMYLLLIDETAIPMLQKTKSLMKSWMEVRKKMNKTTNEHFYFL